MGQACLVTVFKNCVFFLKNKENKGKTKNTFDFFFFLFEKAWRTLKILNSDSDNSFQRIPKQKPKHK